MHEVWVGNIITPVMLVGTLEFVQKSGMHHLGYTKNLVKNGINYQAQLVWESTGFLLAPVLMAI